MTVVFSVKKFANFFSSHVGVLLVSYASLLCLFLCTFVVFHSFVSFLCEIVLQIKTKLEKYSSRIFTLYFKCTKKYKLHVWNNINMLMEKKKKGKIIIQCFHVFSQNICISLRKFAHTILGGNYYFCERMGEKCFCKLMPTSDNTKVMQAKVKALKLFFLPSHFFPSPCKM